MLEIHSDMPIDTKYYETAIGVNGTSVYLDYIKYCCAMEYLGALKDTAFENASCELAFASSGSYRTACKPALIDVLLGYLGVSEKMLPRGKKGDFNASEEVLNKILNTKRDRKTGLIFPQYQTLYEVINSYLEYSSAEHTHNLVKSKIGQGRSNKRFFIDTDLKSVKGTRLVECFFSYSRGITGRYYTNNDNIQQYPYAVLPSICAPEDYVLVWSDFDQIDFRVLCNLVLLKGDPKFKEIFSACADKYEAIARLVSYSKGESFDYDKFVENRPAIKRAVLSRSYGAGSETMISYGFKSFDDALALDSFFNNHPEYKRFYDSLINLIDTESEIVLDNYFGERMRLVVTQEDREFKGRKKRLLDQALNYPIQSTTNAIVMHWVNTIVKRFRDLGFQEDKFRVYMIRHDEGVFLMHKDCMNYSWIFKDVSEVSLDDWDVLSVSPEFGYYYKEASKSLTEQYEKSIEKNKDRIEPFRQGSKRHEFNLVKEKLHVYCYNCQANYAFLMSEFCTEPTEFRQDFCYLIERAKKFKENPQKFSEAMQILNDSALKVIEELTTLREDDPLFEELSMIEVMHKTGFDLARVREICERYLKYKGLYFFRYKGDCYCMKSDDFKEFLKQEDVCYVTCHNLGFKGYTDNPTNISFRTNLGEKEIMQNIKQIESTLGENGHD